MVTEEAEAATENDHIANGVPSRLVGPVVVTGGTGFLGTVLVRKLRQAGVDDVRALDMAAGNGVGEYRLDIRSDNLDPALEGARTVLHAAACQYHTPLAKSTYDLPFFPVNVDGTRRVLEAAKRGGAQRFVFVSTNMVYGVPTRLPLGEDHQCEPFGPYGRSKLDAEALVRAANSPTFRTAVVRPGLIVGPGRVGLVARMFEAILRNKSVPLIGSGRNRYEMMHVEDVASLVIAASQAPEYAAFNCGTLSVPTMREWIMEVVARAQSRSRVVSLPARPVQMTLAALERFRLAPLRKDQYFIAASDYYLDWSLAREKLGWSPQWEGLAAVLDTFRWYTSVRRA